MSPVASGRPEMAQDKPHRVFAALSRLGIAVLALACGCGKPPAIPRTVYPIDKERAIVVTSKDIGGGSWIDGDLLAMTLFMQAVDGTRRSPLIQIDSGDVTGNYEIIRSADGNVVGLQEKGKQGFIVACYDFSNGQSYPLPGSPAVDAGKSLAGRIVLLTKLQQGYPDRAYVSEGPREALDVGPGRRIVITEFTVNMTRTDSDKLYRSDQLYQVYQDGKEMIPEADLAIVGFEGHGYTLVTAEGGDLVAVVEKGDPKKVQVLHDFVSGLSWPAGRGSERYDELIGRMHKEHPELHR
jgi:hypothetical protein